MKRVFTSILLVFAFPFKLIKKTKLDNFVGGLIFGAVFSLVVNIATVKIQEDINKQRALEAVEREMIFHTITANNLIKSENIALKAEDREQITQDMNLGVRFDTKIWDSNLATPYIFELEPNTAGMIESYYSAIVKTANRYMDNNEKLYEEIGEGCSYYSQFQQPENQITTDADQIKRCNDIKRRALSSQNLYNGLIYQYVDDIHKVFHPTQDRLDNWWLSMLLGNKAYEVVKVYSGQ